MLKVYTYKNCSTCRKATAWLREKGVSFEELPIRETPPTAGELEAVLKAYGGGLRRLFNTSGQDYRALGLKDSLPGMDTSEAVSLLAGNGNLVKRPFLTDAENGLYQVGFREAEWEQIFG